MRRRARLGACLGAVITAGLAGCHDKSAPEAPPPASAPATPDRLANGERLPEAEIAFGVPLPAGMRVVRHFNDSAYFSGDLELDGVLEHVRRHVRAEPAQMRSQAIVFPRATALGDDGSRLLRIELSKIPGGTQLHIKDITPPPALSGLSEAEMWSKAGRKPDGTPLDPNQLY
jgi:hypothetical protein